MSKKMTTEALLSNEELWRLREIIEKYQPRYGMFEREILLPQVIERLRWVYKLCDGMVKTCNDTKVHYDLGLVFEKMVKDGNFAADSGGVDPAKSYFDIVASQLDQDFMTPIKVLLDEFQEKKSDYETTQLAHFFNRASNVFQIFIGLKNQLFHYSASSFVSKRLDNGSIEISPPVELDIIILPFKTSIWEISDVSANTIESIQLWGNTLRENKTQFIELALKTVESKTALLELGNTKRNFWVQIFISIIAILLIILGYFGNLLLDNRVMSKTLDVKLDEIAEYKKQSTDKDKKIQNLTEELAKSSLHCSIGK